MSKLAKVTQMILLVCAASCAVMFVLLGAFNIAFEAVILGVLLLIFRVMINSAVGRGGQVSSGNSAGMMIIAGFTLLLTFTTPPFISSRVKWQYPLQRAYIGHFRNVKEPEEFPDFLADAESGYGFEYMPAIMQGSGFYVVTFMTSPEKAADYAAEFAPRARYTVPFSELDSGGRYVIEDFTPRENSYDDGTLYVQLSDSLRSGCSESAEVYVLDAVLNPNHPHSTAVIVDTETGMIGLSRLG